MEPMHGLRAGLLAAVLSLGSGAVVATCAHDAGASVALAVAFDDLVRDTDSVGVVTPVEQHAVWEDGRIYT
jgi:hypothetical protein